MYTIEIPSGKTYVFSAKTTAAYRACAPVAAYNSIAIYTGRKTMFFSVRRSPVCRS